MKIEAIETEYKGVRFRSRTEARWAVFFDALGIGWEYEPEAFRLSDGSCYLPDFRVNGTAGGAEPESSTFVEVKPVNGARGLDLVSRFTSEAYRERGDHTLVVRGSPSDRPPYGPYPFTFYETRFRHAVSVARGYRFWDPPRHE